MTETLPPAEILRCYFADGFQPRLPAMCLRWPPGGEVGGRRRWHLPGGVCLSGPAPERFGLTIQRWAADAYAVRLLWDRTCLTWTDVTRRDLLAGSLPHLLAALGTDLWYLLDQPVRAGSPSPPRAA